MINLDVLEKDININILANLSIRDMSQVFRVNKNLFTSQRALLPSLQKVIEEPCKYRGNNSISVLGKR